MSETSHWQEYIAAVLTRPSGPMKTYSGSCHCGNLRYTASLPENLSTASNGKCNCTICTKTNFHSISMPDLKLSFKPADPKDPSTLGDYTFGSAAIHHVFCKICGIRVYCHGNVPDLGGEYIWLNLNTLDEVDLSTVKCSRYVDGRQGTWIMSTESPIAPGGW